MKLNCLIELNQNEICQIGGASFMKKCQDECKRTDYSRENNCMSVCFWVNSELRRILENYDNYEPYSHSRDCSRLVGDLYYGK